MDSDSIPDDGVKATMVGHILIRDVTTGEVLLNQRDNSVSKEKKGDTDANN